MKTRANGEFLKAKIAKTILAASMLACVSGAASAAVMTFVGIPGNQVTLASYNEDGITAVSTNGGVFWGYPSAGQLHLDPAGFGDSDYDFTFGGQAFNLLSVDVSFASTSAIGTWTAYDAANNLVASYAMSGATLHTDTGFAGFDGIYRVHLTNTGNHFSIDNLTVAAADTGDVPEPFSLALLGIGALGLASSRRKK